MRVALVGWDLDEAVAGALSGLGVDLVAFTRWHEGEPFRQGRGGWLIERCPHRLGGGPKAEARSFRESVASRDATYYGVTAGGFDLIHTLDPIASDAASGLAEASPAAARVRSIRPPDSGFPEWTEDRLIFDHPQPADEGSILDRRAGGSSVVPSLSALRGGAGPPDQARDPLRIAFWVPRVAELAAPEAAEALVLLRRAGLPVSAQVLGFGTAAEALRRALLDRGLLDREAAPPSGLLSEENQWAWTSAVAAAHLLVIPGADAASDPAALCAWAMGVPALAAGPRGASDLAEAIRGRLQGDARSDRLLRAGSALARRALEPAGVAAGWLGAYLDAVSGARTPTPPLPATPARPLADRSRLHLVPVSAHEAYASWHVARRDWERAIHWLGTDATRAVAVLRLQDITALDFHGGNAHRTWDIDLSYGERSRLLRFDRPGLSLAPALGVRSARGTFLPIARAGLVHLPAGDPTDHPAARRLGVLPRRAR